MGWFGKNSANNSSRQPNLPFHNSASGTPPTPGTRVLSNVPPARFSNNSKPDIHAAQKERMNQNARESSSAFNQRLSSGTFSAQSGLLNKARRNLG